jgi:CRP-like cAMP-binding protein
LRRIIVPRIVVVVTYCHLYLYLLTDEEQDYLGRNRQIVRYHKGEILRKQGTAMSHVLSVNAGLVKVYLGGPSQRNTIIRIVQAPQFIGGPGVHFDRLHHYSILALTDAIVCMSLPASFSNC